MTRKKTAEEESDPGKVLTTRDLFSQGHRRGAMATDRLQSAYGAMFGHNGKPTQEDRDLVMCDLAELSGYHEILPIDAPDGAFRDHNGSRKVFARILSLTELPLTQLKALRNAALLERQTTQEEGER